MNFVLLFIFGLIFGSFLNVISFRYQPEGKLLSFKSLGGRSHCPNCKQILKWYELIPLLSFIVQRGKCRTCGMRISWQYPLVEFISGIIFLLPLYLYNPFIPNALLIIQSLVWVLVFLIFLLLWTIDYRLYLIPDELNLGLAFLGIVLAVSNSFLDKLGLLPGSFLGSYADLFGFGQNILLNHFFGFFAGISIVGGIILLTRGRGMGMGDLKLMGALGVLYGWPDILFIFILGSFIGAVASVYLMVSGKKDMKSSVPFGPFLVLAAVLIFFFGEVLLGNYFKLFF